MAGVKSESKKQEDWYDDYVRKVSIAESGGKANAQSKSSSAFGKFQFVKKTWDYLRKTYPSRVNQLVGEEVPDFESFKKLTKKDVDKSVKYQNAMMRILTEENKRYLGNKGIPINNLNLYMTHFLGSGGFGQKFFPALLTNKDMKVKDVLSESQYNANKSLFEKHPTLGDVYSEMGRRIKRNVRFDNNHKYKTKSAEFSLPPSEFDKELGLNGKQVEKSWQEYDEDPNDYFIDVEKLKGLYKGTYSDRWESLSDEEDSEVDEQIPPKVTPQLSAQFLQMEQQNKMLSSLRDTLLEQTEMLRLEKQEKEEEKKRQQQADEVQSRLLKKQQDRNFLTKMINSFGMDFIPSKGQQRQ